MKLIDLRPVETIPAISTGDIVKDNIANARLYVESLHEKEGLYPVFVRKDFDLVDFCRCTGYQEKESKEFYEKVVENILREVDYSCFDVWLGRFLYNYCLDCYREPNDVHGFFNKLIPPASAEFKNIFENAKEITDFGIYHEDEVAAKHADMSIHYEDYVLAFLPIKNPWEALAWFPMGSFNLCPPPEYHIALAKELYKSFGAHIMFIGRDRYTYYIDKPLFDIDKICKLSKTLIIADGDIFPNYMDAANQTIGRHTWQFWWD